MQRPYTRPIAEADLAFAAERTAHFLSVFVAGPEISVDWSPEDWLQRSPSSRLRLKIKEYLEQLNHSVVLGEHRGVQEMADDHIPTAASVVVTETYLAAKRCDCVVIIPDSPGSFCELGAWATLEDITKKMLILADARYEAFRSYINPGVFGFARSIGATIKWVNYETFDPDNDGLKEFILKHQDRGFAKKVLHG